MFMVAAAQHEPRALFFPANHNTCL